MEQWIPHIRETWPWIFGRLKKDHVGQRYLGYWNDNGPVCDKIELPKGTKVRIVMVSSFGDVGVTDRLDDTRGYIIRLPLYDIERDYEHAGTQKNSL